MNEQRILELEKMGDVDGLIRALKEIPTHTEGGAAITPAAPLLGIDLSAYTTISVVDLTGNTRTIDDSVETRAAAARALSRLNNRNGNRALAEALRDDSAVVRAAVIDALCAACGRPMERILANLESESNFARADTISEAVRLVDDEH